MWFLSISQICCLPSLGWKQGRGRSFFYDNAQKKDSITCYASLLAGRKTCLNNPSTPANFSSNHIGENWVGCSFVNQELARGIR